MVLPGTTPAALTRLAAAAAMQLGVPPVSYSGLLGMAPEHLDGDRYRTPASTTVRLWQLMTLQAPWTDVASQMARQSTLGALGIWDYLFTEASTPLEGLRDAVTYLATVGDTGTEALLVDEDERRLTLTHMNAADLTDEVASAIRAYSLGLLRQRLSFAARRPITPTQVALAVRAPRHHRTLTELYGTRAIEFASPANSITFNSTDLRATQHHAPGLSALLRQHAKQSLSNAVPLRDWLDLFRTTLSVATHASDAPTLRTISRRMALSTRTLQRRLEEHQTTWTDELESVRRKHALHLIRTTDMTLDAVAERTGYADPRGLRRAVHRWTGHSPTWLRWSEAGSVTDLGERSRRVSRPLHVR